MLSIENFKWSLAFDKSDGYIMCCIPRENEKQYPYSLAVWSGNFSFCGSIALLNDDETIEMSGGDLFRLIDKMQERVIKLHEG